MNDDSALLRQFVENRSDEAFSELVRRYVNLVYSTALRETRGDIHRAEEATQLVFIDLARKASSLVNRTVLGGWLYLGVAFAVARLARSERRWRLREHEANTMHELNAESSARDVDWNRLRPVLDAVMREMGQCDREAVLLRFFEGHSFSQIGERLRLTEDAARKRVERALGKLQSLLERRGIRSSAAALASVLATEAVTAAPPGLAGAAAGAALMVSSGTIGIFALMSTTKLIFGIVGVAVLTGAVGYTLKNRISLEQTPLLQALPLRATEQRQSNSGDELARLQAENMALKSVRADLEVRLARRLRSPASGIVPEGMKPISAWKNAGRATPDAAIGTVLWAASSQDVDTLASMMALTPEARQKAEALFAGLPQATQDEFGSPNKLLATLNLGDIPSEPVLTGVQVLGPKRQNADDQDMEMSTLLAFSDGTTQTIDYPLQRQGDGGWSLRIVPGLVDRWARTIGGIPATSGDTQNR